MERLRGAVSAVFARLKATMAGEPNYVGEIEQIVETSKTSSVWLNRHLASVAKHIRCQSHEPHFNGLVVESRMSLIRGMLLDRWRLIDQDTEEARAFRATTDHRDAVDEDYESAIETMHRIAEVCRREAARQHQANHVTSALLGA
jgi:hypothetical protein